MQIITKYKLTKIIDYIKKYDEIIILGKGPTFKIPDKKQITFTICINDTINQIDFCDMLVVNDIVTWERINNNKIKNLKYILTPLYPHYNILPNPKKYNLNWTVSNLKKKGFEGNLIIYNLLSSKPDNKYVTLQSVISGSNNAIDFCISYFKNLKQISLYGVGIINKDKYNNIFEKTEGYYNYNNKYLERIRNHIVITCKDNNINVIFN